MYPFNFIDYSLLDHSVEELRTFMNGIYDSEVFSYDIDLFEAERKIAPWSERMHRHYDHVRAVAEIFEHNEGGETFTRLVLNIINTLDVWSDGGIEDLVKSDYDEGYTLALDWLLNRIAEITPQSSSFGKFLINEILMEIVRLVCLHNPDVEGGSLALYYYQRDLEKEERTIRSELLRLGHLLYLIETSSLDKYQGKRDTLELMFVRNPLKLARIDWSKDVKRKDSLERGIRYAALAYRQHVPNGNVMPITAFSLPGKGALKGINGRFHFGVLNLNGYIGIPQNTGRKRIVLAFSGTEFRLQMNQMNWVTNFCQGLLGPTIVYRVASGILNHLYEYQSSIKSMKSYRIEVYGHSLGGGLMQYAVSSLGVQNVRGYGYNSASLNWMNYWSENPWKNISHLYLPNDVIFKITGVQLGRAVNMNATINSMVEAHKLEIMQANSAYPNESALLV